LPFARFRPDSKLRAQSSKNARDPERGGSAPGGRAGRAGRPPKRRTEVAFIWLNGPSHQTASPLCRWGGGTGDGPGIKRPSCSAVHPRGRSQTIAHRRSRAARTAFKWARWQGGRERRATIRMLSKEKICPITSSAAGRVNLWHGPAPKKFLPKNPPTDIGQKRPRGSSAISSSTTLVTDRWRTRPHRLHRARPRKSQVIQTNARPHGNTARRSRAQGPLTTGSPPARFVRAPTFGPFEGTARH